MGKLRSSLTFFCVQGRSVVVRVGERQERFERAYSTRLLYLNPMFLTHTTSIVVAHAYQGSCWSPSSSTQKLMNVEIDLSFYSRVVKTCTVTTANRLH